ncbi:MAG TPA: hypothetical protein VIJ15_10875 [Dermatophilaceae bacterium]
MNSTMNSVLDQQHQADLVRTISHARSGHSGPRTRGDGATNPWNRLAHSSLNQAKMAAPRTAFAASSSSVPYCP